MTVRLTETDLEELCEQLKLRIDLLIAQPMTSIERIYLSRWLHSKGDAVAAELEEYMTYTTDYLANKRPFWPKVGR